MPGYVAANLAMPVNVELYKYFNVIINYWSWYANIECHSGMICKVNVTEKYFEIFSMHKIKQNIHSS